MGRGHEHSLLAVDVVDRGRLCVDEVGKDRQAPVGGPGVRAQEHGRGPVGQRSGVAGRHGGVLAGAEDRAELGELVHGGVRAKGGVPGQPVERREQVVEEASLVGGSEVVVAGRGELVLRPAGDGPLARGLRHVLAHRQPCARLGVLRDRRHEVPRAETAQRSQSLPCRPGPVEGQQRLPQALAHGDRRVGGGVGASRDAGLDLAQGDLVGHEDGGLETGAAGLLHVEGGRGRGEARAQHRLPGEVVVAAVLEDGAGHDLPDPLAGQAVAGDQPLERRGQHLLVARAGIGAVGAGEGDPVATDDGGATLR